MKLLKSLSTRFKKLNKPALTGMLAGFMLTGSRCYASMAWEGPLTTIKESITGPVATGVCTIIVVITGIMIGCGEGGAAGRKLLMLVCGLSMALAVASFISTFNS